MNVFEFVVGLSLISTAGWLINNWIRAKHGDGPFAGYDECLAALAAAVTDEEVVTALWMFTEQRWRGVAVLEPLADKGSVPVRTALAWVLRHFRGPAARELLVRLATDEVDEVRAAAEWSLGAVPR